MWILYCQVAWVFEISPSSEKLGFRAFLLFRVFRASETLKRILFRTFYFQLHQGLRV